MYCEHVSKAKMKNTPPGKELMQSLVRDIVKQGHVLYAPSHDIC